MCGSSHLQKVDQKKEIPLISVGFALNHTWFADFQYIMQHKKRKVDQKKRNPTDISGISFRLNHTWFADFQYIMQHTKTRGYWFVQVQIKFLLHMFCRRSDADRYQSP